MNLAFCLYKYFPYGGMQRDMIAIAQNCLKLGHSVTVLTSAWQGPRFKAIKIIKIPARGLSSHGKFAYFAKQVLKSVDQFKFDNLIGFNKMPGLDFYFMADACLKAKIKTKPFFYPWLPRYHQFLKFEAQVFSPKHNTTIFVLTPNEMTNVQALYHTPKHQLYLLPPGIARDRCPTIERLRTVRAPYRHQHNIQPDDHLLLFIGTSFRTKGLDRTLLAIAALPTHLQQQTHLWVVGKDNPKSFQHRAKKLGIARHIHFLSGRDDIPDILLSCDMLIHPAYQECAGHVLLEAAINGLPVLTTANCGYSHYIDSYQMGQVLPEPFSQTALNQALASMLVSPHRDTWRNNGLAFGRAAHLYAMPEKAAAIIHQKVKLSQN